MENKAQEVQKIMDDMIKAKQDELEQIRAKQDEAAEQADTAEKAIRAATMGMDLPGYEEAKRAKEKAQNALEMYTGRYEQIRLQEYISEEESDKVIDSLLEYETTLAEDFKAAAGVQLKKLAELLKDYKAAVQDVENTLTSWQRDIHANYNTRGGSIFYDEFTGQHTHRSPQPVPVHRFTYTGCPEAERMGHYLEKEAPLVKG